MMIVTLAAVALLVAGQHGLGFQPPVPIIKVKAGKSQKLTSTFLVGDTKIWGHGGGYSQADLDNHADQMNPNNDAYWSSRDDDDDEDEYSQAELDNHADQMNPNNDDDDGDDDYEYSQAELDNHADQMNPNNDAYWSSRG